MSLFEQYRMCVPLFFPSLNLLTHWQYPCGLVSERTWDSTLYGKKANESNISGISSDIPDHNNDIDQDPIRYCPCNQ